MPSHSDPTPQENSSASVTSSASGGVSQATNLGNNIINNNYYNQGLEAVNLNISTDDNDMVLWDGPPIDKIAEVAWGTGEAPPTNINLKLHSSVDMYGDLVTVLLRLALHAGSPCLFATEPSVCVDRINDLLRKCVGVPNSRIKSRTGIVTTNNEVSLKTLGAADLLFEFKKSPLGSTQDIASELTRSMDKWTIKELDRKIQSSLNDRLLPESHNLLHAEYIDPMRAMWRTWRKELSQAGLRSLFLACSMYHAESGTESSQLTTGMMRVGRLTLPALSEAMLFALALGVAVEPNMIPAANIKHVPTNFRFLNESAQLFGVKLISGKNIGQYGNEISWSTDFVLLPHHYGPVFDVVSSRRLSKTPDLIRRFTNATSGRAFIVTFDNEMQKLLDMPPRLLAEYIAQALDEHSKATETEIIQISRFRTGSSNVA